MSTEGKRGTVKLDPTATVPEALPRVRFADDPAPSPVAPKDPRHVRDRSEFVRGVAPKRGHAPTGEMTAVDVSRADPRQARTKEVSRLPLEDRGYDPSGEKITGGESSSVPAWKAAIAAAGIAVFIVALYLIASHFR